MALLIKIVTLAVFAAVAFATVNASAEEYAIDAQKSKLAWTGEKLVKSHHGTVDIKSGSLIKSGNQIIGDFVIDMTTIKDEDLQDKTWNDKLIGHLKSDDFFSVEKHNNAFLKIKKMVAKQDGDNNQLVTADLTIKGITNEITFPAKVDFNGNTMNAYAKFDIDRSKWNVRFGSKSFFNDLGDAMIKDEIKFEVNLVGSKK